MDKKQTKLKPYMAYLKDMAHEEACLVFARNSKEARKVSWKQVGWLWYSIDCFVDWRVKLIKEDWDYFFTEEADKELLKKNIPHVIERPKVCKRCNMWGGRLINGVCEYCMEEN